MAGMLGKRRGRAAGGGFCPTGGEKITQRHGETEAQRGEFMGRKAHAEARRRGGGILATKGTKFAKGEKENQGKEAHAEARRRGGGRRDFRIRESKIGRGAA